MKVRLTEGGSILNRVQWSPVGSASNISPSRIRSKDMPVIERALKSIGRRLSSAQINTADSASGVARILPELKDSVGSPRLPGFCAIRVGDNRSIVLYANAETGETLLLR